MLGQGQVVVGVEVKVRYYGEAEDEVCVGVDRCVSEIGGGLRYRLVLWDWVEKDRIGWGGVFGFVVVEVGAREDD